MAATAHPRGVGVLRRMTLHSRGGIGVDDAGDGPTIGLHLRQGP